ncbi:MAG: tetratricopeptide repeat protein [Treponema sp.]|jgi:tetratricopeptide (TPR) repeat protein|nr:tetratricopeptide repeat protein [Treponema sp.]
MEKKKFVMVMGVLAMASFILAVTLVSLSCATSGSGKDVKESIYRRANAYRAKGQKLFEKGEYARAIEEFSKAVSLMEKHGVYQHDYGVDLVEGYLANGEPEKAREIIEKPVARSEHRYTSQMIHMTVPVEAYRAWKRGNRALFKEKKYDRAIQEYTQAIDLAEAYTPAYIGRGNAWFETGNHDAAAEDYKTAVSLDPGNSTMGYEHYKNLGEIYSVKGDYVTAYNYLSRGSRFAPYLYTGWELAAAKQKAEEQRKNSAAQKHYEQANAYRDKGDYANAIAQYRAALQNDSGHAEARKNLKAVWDRRIAENLNPYPAPFNGTWKHVTPAQHVPKRTESYMETETYYDTVYGPNHGRKLPYSGMSESDTMKVPRTRQVRRTRTIPAYTIPSLSAIWEFSGSSYRKREDKINEPVLTKLLQGISLQSSEELTMIVTVIGTFYYDGDRIELDDGTVLRFVNGVITDSEGRKYTKQ